MAEKAKMSQDELNALRIENLQKRGLETRRKNAEAKKALKEGDGNITQSPEPPTSSTQPQTSNPKPQTNMVEEPIMPVPEMKDVSPYRVEPKYEEHVLQGQPGVKPKDGTTPPLQEGQAPPTQPADPNFDGNIGGANIYEGPNAVPKQGTPPPMPEAGGGAMPPGGAGPPVMPGAEDPNTGGQPQPGNPQGNTITREQAEKMFNEAIQKYNYFTEHQLGEWVAIKPGKIEELQSAPKELRKEVEDNIHLYNGKNKEALKLNDDDIAMLKEPAIAVLQEEGVALTNGQLLMIAAIQVGLKKLEVLVKIIYYSKAVKEQIREAVRNGVEEMRGIYNKTSDVLSKAKQFAEQQEQRFKNMEADFKRRQEEFEQRMREQSPPRPIHVPGVSSNGNVSSNGFKKEEHVEVAKGPDKIISPLETAGYVAPTGVAEAPAEIKSDSGNTSFVVEEPSTLTKEANKNPEDTNYSKGSPHNE